MFSLMLFIFLCFLGMLAVQFYMLRSQERLNRALRDEHAQMRVLLRAMEARLDALGCPAPKLAETAVQATPAAQDPLLHLSFDAPAAKKAAPRTPVVDPGLDLHMDSSRLGCSVFCREAGFSLRRGFSRAFRARRASASST